MKIALGTAQFGLDYGVTNHAGKVADRELNNILEAAKLGNIDTLDTAIDYGNCEERLGASDIRGFNVITKLPHFQGAAKELEGWVNDAVSGSLKRLKTPKLEGLLLHEPSMLRAPNCDGLPRILSDLKQSGRVNKVGISVYNLDELEFLIDEYPIDIVQVPFNLIDQRVATSGWLTRLAQRNIEVHARSAFLQGLLLLDAQTLPAYFTQWSSLWHSWDRWCVDHEARQKLGPCLAFLRHFSEVTRIIVGVTNQAQLRELLSASEIFKFQSWPSIQSTDERLIDPSRWPKFR